MRALPSGIFIVGTAECDCVARDLHQSSPWPCSAKEDVAVDFDFRGTLQANDYIPGNHHRSLRCSCMGEVDMVRHKSRSWLDTATIVQCQDNHFVDFRLHVTPMSQERPHNLR
jgi:hypothetical protein